MNNINTPECTLKIDTGPLLTSVFLMRELCAARVSDATALRADCVTRLAALARLDPKHAAFYQSFVVE